MMDGLRGEVFSLAPGLVLLCGFCYQPETENNPSIYRQKSVVNEAIDESVFERAS